MECGEERNVDKYSFSNSRGIWHPLPRVDACLNLENTRMNTLRFKIAVSSTIPHPVLSKESCWHSREKIPRVLSESPPQRVLPVKSAGSPTEGLMANMSDRAPHLIPPLKQLVHLLLIEKIIWKPLTKLKWLGYGEMDVQSRSSILLGCSCPSCSSLSLQLAVAGLTVTCTTTALPSCLQDTLPLGSCFLQQQHQQDWAGTKRSLPKPLTQLLDSQGSEDEGRQGCLNTGRMTPWMWGVRHVQCGFCPARPSQTPHGWQSYLLFLLGVQLKSLCCFRRGSSGKLTQSCPAVPRKHSLSSMSCFKSQLSLCFGLILQQKEHHVLYLQQKCYHC